MKYLCIAFLFFFCFFSVFTVVYAHEKANPSALPSLSPKLQNQFLINRIIPSKSFPQQKKNTSKSLGSLTKALEDSLTRYGQKHPSNGILCNKIGQIYYQKKDFAQALHFYQLVLQAYIPSFNQDHIAKNPKSEQLPPELELLFALKNKAYALYDWAIQEDDLASMENALACFQLFSKHLETLRWCESFNKKNYTLSDITTMDYGEIMEKALKTALLLYEKKEQKTKYLEAAFTFVERHKSLALLEGIAVTEKKIADKVPIRVLAKEGILREEITKTEWRLWEAMAKNDEKATYIEDSLFKLRRKEGALIQQLQEQYPDYYHLKYHIKVGGVKEIQTRLQIGTGLIEYFLGTKKIYAFLITKNAVKVYQWERDADLEDLVRELSKGIGNKEFIRENRRRAFNFYAINAYKLYEKLLADILEKRKIDRLIIIPDGCLSYLPFETLLMSSAHIDSTDYRRLITDYLIYKYPISYSYSASLWLYETVRSRKPKRLYPYVGFVPLYEEKQLLAGQKATDKQAQLRINFDELEGGKEEVDAMNKLLGGSVQAGMNATKESFKKHAVDYQILHLAAQCIANEQQADHSKLLFTPVDSTASGRGNLYAYELYNIRLNADLAVLSICDLGERRDGEGLMSLIRGLMYAGCPSVMMNLWSTEGATKKQVMAYFFEALQEGKAKDVALQTAKIHFLQKDADRITANPFYWGSLIQIGDQKPVVLKSAFNISKYLSWIGGGIAFLGIIWSVWYRQVVVNRKSRILQ